MISSENNNQAFPMTTNPFQHAIVLTGGIATGKSTVVSLFKSFGFSIIDADKIAHKLLDIHHEKIAHLFGAEYVEDKKVLRKKLGVLIFNDVDQKTKLEQFIHPLIHEKIIEEANIFESLKKPYLIDIPLFFEQQHYDIAKSIVVYIPKKMQIERLMKRDNSTQEEAISRINNQLDIEEKKISATYVIDNTKNLKHLENEVERVKALLV
ncbi:MAG: dephospho-CoA kinase [Arcobacteraceae bacterium]